MDRRKDTEDRFVRKDGWKNEWMGMGMDRQTHG